MGFFDGIKNSAMNFAAKQAGFDFSNPEAMKDKMREMGIDPNDPEAMQAKLREMAKDNPQLQQMLGQMSGGQSPQPAATPKEIEKKPAAPAQHWATMPERAAVNYQTTLQFADTKTNSLDRAVAIALLAHKNPAAAKAVLDFIAKMPENLRENEEYADLWWIYEQNQENPAVLVAEILRERVLIEQFIRLIRVRTEGSLQGNLDHHKKLFGIEIEIINETARRKKEAEKLTIQLQKVNSGYVPVLPEQVAVGLLEVVNSDKKAVAKTQPLPAEFNRHAMKAFNFGMTFSSAEQRADLLKALHTVSAEGKFARDEHVKDIAVEQNGTVTIKLNSNAELRLSASGENPSAIDVVFSAQGFDPSDKKNAMAAFAAMAQKLYFAFLKAALAANPDVDLEKNPLTIALDFDNADLPADLDWKQVGELFHKVGFVKVALRHGDKDKYNADKSNDEKFVATLPTTVKKVESKKSDKKDSQLTVRNNAKKAQQELGAITSTLTGLSHVNFDSPADSTVDIDTQDALRFAREEALRHFVQTLQVIAEKKLQLPANLHAPFLELAEKIKSKLVITDEDAKKMREITQWVESQRYTPLPMMAQLAYNWKVVPYFKDNWLMPVMGTGPAMIAASVFSPLAINAFGRVASNFGLPQYQVPLSADSIISGAVMPLVLNPVASAIGQTLTRGILWGIPGGMISLGIQLSGFAYMQLRFSSPGSPMYEMGATGWKKAQATIGPMIEDVKKSFVEKFGEARAQQVGRLITTGLAFENSAVVNAKRANRYVRRELRDAQTATKVKWTVGGLVGLNVLNNLIAYATHSGKVAEPFSYTSFMPLIAGIVAVDVTRQLIMHYASDVLDSETNFRKLATQSARASVSGRLISAANGAASSVANTEVKYTAAILVGGAALNNLINYAVRSSAAATVAAYIPNPLSFTKNAASFAADSVITYTPNVVSGLGAALSLPFAYAGSAAAYAASSAISSVPAALGALATVLPTSPILNNAFTIAAVGFYATPVAIMLGRAALEYAKKPAAPVSVKPKQQKPQVQSAPANAPASSVSKNASKTTVTVRQQWQTPPFATKATAVLKSAAAGAASTSKDAATTLVKTSTARSWQAVKTLGFGGVVALGALNEQFGLLDYVAPYQIQIASVVLAAAAVDAAYAPVKTFVGTQTQRAAASVSAVKDLASSSIGKSVAAIKPDLNTLRHAAIALLLDAYYSGSEEDSISAFALRMFCMVLGTVLFATPAITDAAPTLFRKERRGAAVVEEIRSDLPANAR